MSAVAGDYSRRRPPAPDHRPGGHAPRASATPRPTSSAPAGNWSGEDTRTEVIALPPKYDDRQGELTIQLDPSLAAGMRDGLDYLEHFPYECTEQTVSRFLPNVLTYRALQATGHREPGTGGKAARPGRRGAEQALPAAARRRRLGLVVRVARATPT